jgi:hypothetical protein
MYRVLAKSGEADIVREYAPAKRTIFFGQRAYTLQFPTMLFYQSHGLHIALATEPIKNWSSLVYVPPLGNLYSNNGSPRVCEAVCNARSLKGHINRFWDSHFNGDGAYGANAYRRMFEGGRHKEWAQISKKPNALKIIIGRMKRLEKKEHKGVYGPCYCMPFWKFICCGSRQTVANIEKRLRCKFNLKAGCRKKRVSKAVLKRLGL